MKKEVVNKPRIMLLGLSVFTNNKSEFDPQTAKIGGLVDLYFRENIAAQILDRKNPGVTLSAFTDYASDEHGDYLYFIGEEVASFEDFSSKFHRLIIPAAKYQKFTTPPGKMPEVVISAWQKIWKMPPEELGGKRTYQSDFEVYDQRASDPANTVLDIYIGIK